jgi:hypothetical protein
VLAWSTPAGITYGTALSSTQLNASASFGGSTLAGTFTYAPAAGTVLNAGNGQTLSAAFTPQNTANYNTAAATVLISVLKASQTIAFGALANKNLGDAAFTVVATATSGLPVSFSIVSGPATVTGNTIALTGVGVVTVRASQSGDINFNAASAVEQSFTVGKGNQTISFEALTDKNFGDAGFTLTGTATSGLPVTFEVVSGPATVSGNTITLTGAGTVTVRATQGGNDTYNAATAVEQILCILPAKPVITASGIVLSSSSTVGNQWFLNGEAIANATGQTFIASTQGQYTVSVTGSCGGQVVSEAFTISVSATESPISSDIILYPNPAVEKVVMELPQGVKWQHARIVALGGTAVSQKQGDATHSVVFATSTLAKGMYILEVHTSKGLIRKKFIIR